MRIWGDGLFVGCLPQSSVAHRAASSYGGCARGGGAGTTRQTQGFPWRCLTVPGDRQAGSAGPSSGLLGDFGTLGWDVGSPMARQLGREEWNGIGAVAGCGVDVNAERGGWSRGPGTRLRCSGQR